jgi:hypothetical protein
MLQILRFLTIRKGGVYVHWDALDALSEKTNNAKVLGKKAADSHAHATFMHKINVREAVAKLFRATPDDKTKFCFVKKRFSGSQTEVPSSAPIIL